MSFIWTMTFDLWNFKSTSFGFIKQFAGYTQVVAPNHMPITTN
jgi:hypothetical protein